MVKVGDFWADRYESSIVDAASFNGGKCDGTGNQYGTGMVDDFPSSFPDNGKATKRLHACSRAGGIPSRMVTWFQAAAACAFSGKHLCTNGEWQVAAFGTPEDSVSCNTSGQKAEKAGGRTKCQSQVGARDMVGNLWEWVDHWGQAGMGWITSDGQSTSPWPGAGYGSDRTYNVNGRAYSGVSGTHTNGMPSAAFRGGYYGDGKAAGAFSMTWVAGPSHSQAPFGARCCRR